ncbi:MAG: hypothetical protein J2P19_06895 [Pseudonocardia sp.]|nr:hypothetical protein [Pseudonocardia sp.]
MSSLAVTGAAVGASLLSPLTAAAAPSAWTSPVHPARPGAAGSGGTRCDDVVTDASTDSDEVREALANAKPGEVVCVPVDADTDSDNGMNNDGRELPHRHRHHVEHHRATRPMTSGEHQQRNGCLQGYIVDDCERFSVSNLLHHGIDPFQ